MLPKHGAAALCILAGLAIVGAACGPRPAPVIPTVPLDGFHHAAPRRPTAGAGLTEAARAALHEGWRLVVEGRLGEADRALAPLRETAPGDSGVLGVDGFLALRAGRREDADSLFGRALEAVPGDGFAALGQVLVVLGEEDPESMFRRLRRLAGIEPDAVIVAERLPALTLEVAERRLRRARETAARDRGDPTVADAYRAALEVIPDSADLLLEAAEAASAGGSVLIAREWFDSVPALASASERQALTARIAGAELLADAGLLSESLVRLDRVLAEPGLRKLADLTDRASALERRLEIARVAERYDRIREAERVTREQLAAILSAELGAPEAPEPERPDLRIAIDIERSWAANLIRTALGAGYLRLFPDHTFKPRAFVSRAELAAALGAALGAFDPEALHRAQRDAADRQLTDMPEGHRNRSAAQVAVQLGLLRLPSKDTFGPRGFASGAEAVRAVQALRRLLANQEPELR